MTILLREEEHQQILSSVWGSMKYGLLVDTTKIFFGGLLVEFDIQVIGEGIVSGSLNSRLSRGVLDHFSLSDKIKIYKYLVRNGAKSHLSENYRQGLQADQEQGDEVVCGSSAFSGVEYKCSDGLLSGLIDCGLSRRVRDCISLSDKIKIYKYLMRKCVESHVSKNYRQGLQADQEQGDEVVCGSSAFSGVEYKCSDGLLSGLIDCGLSRRVRDCISLSDKIKIYKYLMRKCVESHVSENSRTNKLPSLSTFIPCWDESSHLTGWLLVQYMYLIVWCVGVVPVYVVLYILYLVLCVYSGVVIYCEIVYLNPLGRREPWWRELLRPLI